MEGRDRRLSWRLVAAFGLVLCLFALLLNSALTHHAPVAVFLLLPVFLFGLMPAPRSLWRFDVDERFVAAVPCRANLFERPPPSSKNYPPEILRRIAAPLRVCLPSFKAFFLLLWCGKVSYVRPFFDGMSALRAAAPIHQ